MTSAKDKDSQGTDSKDLDADGKSKKMGPDLSSIPAIRFSALAHVVAIVVTVFHPVFWPIAIGLVLVNHVLLFAGVLWPKGRIMGPNILRLPKSAIVRNEVALTFDDGPDPAVTPRVLDMLDHFGAKASFFCIAEKAIAHPEIVKEIVRRGHSVENHTYRHSYFFAFYVRSRLRVEIEAAQTAIADITGRLPEFLRAPAGFRGPFLQPVLAQHGIRYVTWTRRGLDGVRSDPKKVLQRLTFELSAGDVLVLHDRVNSSEESEPTVLAVLPSLLHQISQQGLKSVSLPKAFAFENDESKEADLNNEKPFKYKLAE
ncbi:MAG: polysaccharide deacetylase family protein [Pseudomonadota bacterium]